MKKLLSLMTAIALMLTLAGCGSKNETPTVPEVETKTTEIKGYGYGGELKLNLTTKGEEIVDLEFVDGKETSMLFNRAFPILRERILTAQSPIVDNVSGATFTSFAVKKAVAEEMKAEGKDFGEITMTTEPKHEKKQLENLSTDLVIVGAGCSGISAAISAKENGVENVIVVEKLDILSGNGKYNMDFFDHFHSKATVENGNDLTEEEFINSKGAGKGIDSLERLQVWAKEGMTLDDWLRGMNIELNYNYVDQSHMAEADEYAGDVIQTNLERVAKELGVKFITGTKGTDIIMNNGKACGVKVESRDGYYDINAKAVIIATGGYANNKELMAKYKPELKDYLNTNQCGATGDFIPVLEKYDAKFGHMSWNFAFRDILVPSRILTGGADFEVRVNANGERRDKATNEECFLITDKTGYDSFYRTRKHVDLGFYTVADTIEELATKLGIDQAGLEASLESYVAEGKRGLDKTGPYYGTKVTSAIHVTKGGVVANEKSEVLNNNDEVIEGLYASGDVTDTMAFYQGSVVFGKVAGQEAAKFILDK